MNPHGDGRSAFEIVSQETARIHDTEHIQLFYCPTRPAQVGARQKHRVIYGDWVYECYLRPSFAENPLTAQTFRYMGLRLQELSTIDNADVPVPIRPATPTTGVHSVLVAINVLFTDCLGILSQHHFQEIRTLFDNGFRWCSADEADRNYRWISQEIIREIMIGLCQGAHPMHMHAAQHTDVHSLQLNMVSIAVNIVELLFCDRVRVCHDGVMNNMYSLRTVRTVPVGAELGWSVDLPGLFLRSQVANLQQSIIGSNYYANNSGTIAESQAVSKSVTLFYVHAATETDIANAARSGQDRPHDYLYRRLNMTVMLAGLPYHVGDEVRWRYGIDHMEIWPDFGDTRNQLDHVTEEECNYMLDYIDHELGVLETMREILQLRRDREINRLFNS